MPSRPLHKLDAKNAYLQGDAIERELYKRQPAGGIPGLPDGALLKARVSIYGTGNAARRWWKRALKCLLGAGWGQSQLEPALFLLWDKDV